MKKALSLMILTVVAVLLLPGCQKLFDYIKDNPGEAKKYCKVTKLKWRKASGYTETKIIYNAAGNPVSLLVDGNNGAELLWDYRYRYDKKNRLSDHIMNLYPGPGVMQWDRFSYPDQHRIVDTSFFYSGKITDVIPPNAATAYQYTVNVHYLDNKGRIYKTNQLALDGTVAHTTNYTYDAAGNRVTEWATYDDKVNPYRTNPVWSLIHWDYSVNNPLYFGNPLLPNNEITAYNDWGLPLKMISKDGLIFGNRYDTLEIEYQCSK